MGWRGRRMKEMQPVRQQRAVRQALAWQSAQARRPGLGLGLGVRVG